MKHRLKKYADSWWLPGLLAFVPILLWTLSMAFGWRLTIFWPDLLGVFFIPLILGLLAVTIRSLVTKHWWRGIIQWVLFLTIIIGSFFALIFFVDLDDGEDSFGKNIIIPRGMKFEEPLLAGELSPNPVQDKSGQQLISTFSRMQTPEPLQKVPTGMNVLNEFSGQSRERLLRHLASSAQWFLTRENNRIYAYRRFVIGGCWQSSLNGYYSDGDFIEESEKCFQFRIIVGPDGPVMNRPWSDRSTTVKASEGRFALKTVEDKEHGQGVESYLVLTSNGGALEVFEQSPSHDRRLTAMVLQQIGKEFQALITSPISKQQGYDPALMPPESIKTGSPEIHLVNGMQGGIYLVYSYINPGEPGYVYLKVFEATQNTALSPDFIRKRSVEYTGWSNDKAQQFFYNSEITIYEGNWGVYYPARFELWFVPSSGGNERKLIEKIFKIEGWQR